MRPRFDPGLYGHPVPSMTSRQLRRVGGIVDDELEPLDAVRPALPLSAYPTRQIRRLEARKRAKEAAKRLGKGVTA